MKYDLKDYRREITWSEEDSCYLGRCPDLFTGGCHGDDRATVAEELEALICFAAEGYLKDGKPLPAPSARQPRLAAAHPARRRAGINQKAFAKAIGVSPATVRRVEQGEPAKGATRTLLGLLAKKPELMDELR